MLPKSVSRHATLCSKRRRCPIIKHFVSVVFSYVLSNSHKSLKSIFPPFFLTLGVVNILHPLFRLFLAISFLQKNMTISTQLKCRKIQSNASIAKQLPNGGEFLCSSLEKTRRGSKVTSKLFWTTRFRMKLELHSSS